jgi:Lrp/AsnC family transcriptional regulator, leucine-responsive regulatory protein
MLDDAGWRILEVLQTDARLSFREIGRRVGLSSPTVAERIRRMEDSGVIAGYRVALALEKLFPVTAIVRINAPEQNCVALGARARDLPEVVEAYRVTGDDRLVAKVIARSVEHLDSVIAQLARYGTVTASVILRSRSRPATPLS